MSAEKRPREGVLSDSDDDAPRKIVKKGANVRKGIDCPYLDTIKRQMLDFDFERCCSVSLSAHNVYGCLVCGKYFQGRGQNTHAYTHSLEADHHIFINLHTGKVYCLPDGYEVEDKTLEDIRYVLNPTYNKEQLGNIAKSTTWSRALDGTEYMPGTVGLNNLSTSGTTDYVNVVVQLLNKVGPIRDFFLIAENYKLCGSVLVQRYGELVRKLWNPRAYKGQVSPHEFMQAVMMASKRRFVIDVQSDPVDFLSWLLNQLHLDLTGGKRKKRSVITDNMQGELEVWTEAKSTKGGTEPPEDKVDKVPFLMLGLDLPPPPLFQDVMEKNIIPQVQLYVVLKKFDDATIQDNPITGRKKYKVSRLPRFLVLHMKRFTKNNFFVEKNPTIVNFPIKNLELKDVIPVPAGAKSSKYDLMGSICHQGKREEGTYRVHTVRESEGTWYELQDLHVSEMLPQMVALAETYLQVYEMQPAGASKGAGAMDTAA